MADIVIRNGTVIDGSGSAPFEADIAIENGRITGVGNITARGVEEIDARGQIVTPGFIDPHSHSDAQATWSSRITPSSWHGVTTTMIGNCGVGFAPCEPANQGLLIKLMEGVEDIPEPVLIEGLPWNWRSFPDFLDALEARPYDLDIATQVPHAAVRVRVSSAPATRRAPAPAAEAQEIARLAGEGIKAGALGFWTGRKAARRSRGRPAPRRLDADEAELSTIA